LYFIVKKQQSKCIPLPVYDSIESLTRGAAGRKAGAAIPSFNSSKIQHAGLFLSMTNAKIQMTCLLQAGKINNKYKK
jgi:hypothetical protein